MARKENIIYTELKRFGDLTSAKGVGRAIKSESQCLKVMWIIAVIFLLCITIYNVCNLTLEYTKYNTGTKITEKKTDIEHTGSDILLCNMNPYSTTSLNKTLEQRKSYEKLIIKWTSTDEEQLSREEVISLNNIKQEMLTGQSGFHQHIGHEEASRLSHTCKNFIISCHVYFLDGVMEKSVPCSYTKLKIQKYKHKDYFNCYKIFGENRRSAKPSTGMSFLLNIDDILDTSDLPQNNKGKGAILTIGERGTFMNPSVDGVYILPEYVNTIRFKSTHRKRLSKPHGECIDSYGQEKYMEDIFLNSTFTFPYVYTEEACLSACIEYKIIQTCECQDVGQYGILLNVFSDVSMCGATDQNKDILLKRMKCVQEWRRKFRKQCLPKCPFPCQEKLFDKSVMYMEISSGQIIRKLREEKQRSSVPSLYGEEQDEVPDYDNLNVSHFAWVYLKRERTSYFLVEDIEGMTISDWLAKVGGAMNLWSGITVFVFVEIVDLVCRLVKTMFFSSQASQSSTGCHCECHCSCKKEEKDASNIIDDEKYKQTYGIVNPSVK